MIVDLSHRALLRVSGIDAADFLHKQLSNDILNLGDNQVQLNAYCTHQGKVVALLRVFKQRQYYYLDFPADLLDKVCKRLNMFILNAQVVLSDVSNNFVRLGFINEVPPRDLGQIITYSEVQDLLLLEKSTASTFDLADESHWQFANIKQMLPEVSLATSEKFVPQMLNLDIDELGVNFAKGCYPGQEVVARLHYLGKAKRRLTILKSGQKISTGDELTIKASQSLKASGWVVLVAKVGNIFYCLASVELALIAEDIYFKEAILEKVDV